MTTTMHIESAPMDARALIATFAASPDHAWSIGVAGAIAEFMYDANEAVRVRVDAHGIDVETARGRLALRLPHTLACRVVEEQSSCAATGVRKVEFLAPRTDGSFPAQRVLNELVLEAGSDAPLFELGLGTDAVQFCVRATDPALATQLRGACGRSVFAPDNNVLHDIFHAAPPRVVRSALGSIEVYGPIPAPGGRSPAGPHTHLLPKLLGRDANQDPIVALTLYPAHPLRDKYGLERPFDAGADAAFQDLVARVRAAA